MESGRKRRERRRYVLSYLYVFPGPHLHLLHLRHCAFGNLSKAFTLQFELNYYIIEKLYANKIKTFPNKKIKKMFNFFNEVSK